jgi:hypothetical protein
MGVVKVSVKISGVESGIDFCSYGLCANVFMRYEAVWSMLFVGTARECHLDT